jgi:RNA polymerase sigma-70 factor, ECF subfamily
MPVNENDPTADHGTVGVPDDLSEAVYNELRRLAAYYLQRERPDHTLQPTALVHQAWIRMQAGGNLPWRDRCR